MSEQAVPASSGQAAGGPTPDAIMQLGLGFWGSKTLLSAVELGLFSELASAGALDADALRERLGLHPLAVKVRALANKNRGMDTFRAVEALGLDPDVRDYSIVAPMLRALGVTSVRLLTGNPGEGACHREMRHRGSGSLTLDGRHVPRGSAGSATALCGTGFLTQPLMLSDSDIRAAVANGNMEFRYAYLPKSDGIWEYRAAPPSTMEPEGLEHFARSLVNT